ncbi:MAG TPA: hypothetical protein VNL92_02635, partial [Dehalococcoidia bacterium]|nr:hypothetical protein [Dehalococcoidia bacterium]
RVVDSANQPLAGATITASVEGELCAEATSFANGTYALVVPDTPERPPACDRDGASLQLAVDGVSALVVALPADGARLNVNLVRGEGMGLPSDVSVGFNSPPTPGLNAAVVIGSTAATGPQIAAAASTESGMQVRAVWFFADSRWRVFVPGFLDELGTLTPPLAIFVVLA